MRTVAVADDEPLTRINLCCMLEDLGFEVVGQAADGFDAVEICRNTKPDIVILDVKMPVFDGLTAAEQICKEELAGCVIMLTAFSDEDIVSRSAAAGVSGYLVKPIDKEKLLPTLEVAFAQAARLRELRNQVKTAEEKIHNDRTIHKAQKIFSIKNGCTETKAYELMRKMAMDKRISIVSIAQAIVEQEEKQT